MRINVIFFLILLIGINLWGFEPTAKDFVSNYQYELYKSWLTKMDVDVRSTAGFSNDKVIKIFSYDNKNIIVEYPWENHLIVEQREKLELSFSINTDFNIKQYLHYAESFTYRLNCEDIRFIQDFLTTDIQFEYHGKIDKLAIELFWKNNTKPILPKAVTIISEKRFGFKIPFDNDEFTIWFAEDINLEGQYKTIKDKEKSAIISQKKTEESPLEKKTSPKKIIREIPKITHTEKKVDTKSIPSPVKIIQESTKQNKSKISKFPRLKNETLSSNIYKLPLAEFVKKAYKTRQSKELLHNKISNIEKFIRDEYPQNEISRIDNIYHIQKGKFNNAFGGDIFVKSRQETDCIYIDSWNDYKIKEDYLILPNKEKISLSALNDNEIDKIAPAIPHLIYAHRVLDSRLSNFLMIHDDVNTTLIVHAQKREIYNIYSYANLMLMLNKYWGERELYFSISEIKKVNGNIELIGYLVANDKQTEFYDMAEIWFRLDEDFRIDLIMMMLYPELKKNENIPTTADDK